MEEREGCKASERRGKGGVVRGCLMVIGRDVSVVRCRSHEEVF